MSGYQEPLHEPRSGPYAGMTVAQVQAAIAVAQAALMQLLTGGKPKTLNYSSGDGQKMVSYTVVNESQLRNHIRELQQSIGMRHARRRAPRVVF
jgi:hypothetical protein